MNQETIITAVASAAGTLSMLCLKEYVSAIFKTYPPDIKKHVSLIKKSFLFTLRYIFPIIGIVYIMITTQNVTKFFVFAVALNLCALLANFSFELYVDVTEWKKKSLGYFSSLLDNQKDMKDISKSFLGYQRFNLEMFKLITDVLSKHNIDLRDHPELEEKLKRINNAMNEM